MKNLFFLILFLLGTTVSRSQEINSYKYVIVPQKFDFLNEPDQYQLNSLTKFLLEKYGFESFFEGDVLPAEFSTNPCEALVAEIENNSGLFRTRLNLILKDCYNRQVYISEEGVSKKKDFKEAYQEALRNAFQSIEGLNYSYKETIVSARPGVDYKSENSGKKKEELGTSGNVQNPVPVKNEKNSVQKKSLSDSEINLSRDNTNYLLKKTANGYNFYQEGMEEPFAALVKSTTGGNFLYSAINSQGMAHFDVEGNLVVEVLNTETGRIVPILYKLQP